MSKALIYEAITSFYLPLWIAGTRYYFKSNVKLGNLASHLYYQSELLLPVFRQFPS